MPTAAQIRGMFLEEILLFLLRMSGYKTIEGIEPDDSTLGHSAAGMEVKGRGANHQIDAIADFEITPPFTYPLRLLVEAKCYKGSVGIEIVRNALGVLRDIQEYWVPTRENVPSKSRFHYQYAIFSATRFTDDAQRYAFAQDIYLIPLGKTQYFQPVVDAIMQFQERNIEPSMGDRYFLHSLRMVFRDKLINPQSHQLDEINLNGLNRDLLNTVIERCSTIGAGVLALLNKRIPVFLVSSTNTILVNLINSRENLIRVHYDNLGWYISDTDTQELMFTFDMPQEILDLYIESGILSPSHALDLKVQILGEIELIVIRNGIPNFISLRLDGNWFQELRNRTPQQ